jgi:hypothetical protein
MTVGPVNDKYEQEADTVAKQVVGKLQTPQTQSAPAETAQRQEEEELQMKPLIQRQEEEDELQMKPLPIISSLQRQEEEELQAKGDSMLHGGELSSNIESSVQNAKTGGQPLAKSVRQPMEQAFNADFSSIKIHTDAKANSLNRSIQARAFTTGQDIFFRQGEYNPSSSQGQELLAHELTHTVQQGSAPQTNKQVQRQPVSTIQREETTAPTEDKTKEKPAILKIHSDIEAESMGLQELKGGEVGHSWVSLHWKDPKAVPDDVNAKHKPFLQKGADPFGFWPRMFQDYDPVLNEWQSATNRVGYSSNPFKSYVPGQMLHPDIMHQPKATQIYDITRTQADQVINYAESKRGAQYSVFFYNCTTFAKEAVKAAGLNPPNASSLGICYPNALYDSIKKNHEKGRGTSEITDSSGTTTRVDGVEENKKN